MNQGRLKELLLNRKELGVEERGRYAQTMPTRTMFVIDDLMFEKERLEQENETLSAANNDLKKEILILKNKLEVRHEGD